MVVSLTVTGDRVFAGDQMESCHCFKYRRAENQLVEFADDEVKVQRCFGIDAVVKVVWCLAFFGRGGAFLQYYIMNLKPICVTYAPEAMLDLLFLGAYLVAHRFVYSRSEASVCS